MNRAYIHVCPNLGKNIFARQACQVGHSKNRGLRRTRSRPKPAMLHSRVLALVIRHSQFLFGSLIAALLRLGWAGAMAGPSRSVGHSSSRHSLSSRHAVVSRFRISFSYFQSAIVPWILIVQHSLPAPAAHLLLPFLWLILRTLLPPSANSRKHGTYIYIRMSTHGDLTRTTGGVVGPKSYTLRAYFYLKLTKSLAEEYI